LTLLIWQDDTTGDLIIQSYKAGTDTIRQAQDSGLNDRDLAVASKSSLTTGGASRPAPESGATGRDGEVRDHRALHRRRGR
jgi:hypothetical protein